LLKKGLGNQAFSKANKNLKNLLRGISQTTFDRDMYEPLERDPRKPLSARGNSRLKDIVTISDNFAFVRLPCKTLEIEMKISF